MEGRLYRAEKVDADPFESALAIYDVKCLNILPFYLEEGEEGEFLVTSANGYGNKGRIGVPAYAPLRVVIKSVTPE
jgi:FKBP-type peptidyl-prolyl cis-trans isomerase